MTLRHLYDHLERVTTHGTPVLQSSSVMKYINQMKFAIKVILQKYLIAKTVIAQSRFQISLSLFYVVIYYQQAKNPE